MKTKNKLLRKIFGIIFIISSIIFWFLSTLLCFEYLEFANLPENFILNLSIKILIITFFTFGWGSILWKIVVFLNDYLIKWKFK